MVWSVQLKIGGNYEDVKNLKDCHFTAPLNDVEDFTIMIDHPTPHQRDNYLEDVECNISDGDMSIVGVIVHVDEGEDSLTLKGNGYSAILNNDALNASNTSNETSGTGYDVVYSGVAESSIVSDAIAGSGISVGTNDGAATLRYVRFTNTPQLRAVRFLSESYGKDWRVYLNSGTKTFDFLTHRGSSTMVENFELGVNADIINKQRSKLEYYTKAIVNGANGSTGSYDSGISPAVVKIFKKNEAQTNAECTTIATQLVTDHSAVLKQVDISTPAKGVVLGDEIAINGKGYTLEQFRVVKYENSFNSTRKKLYLVQSGMRMPTNDEITFTRKMLSGVREDAVSIAAGESEAKLTFQDRQNASTSKSWYMSINIDAAQLISPNKASIGFRRVNYTQDNGTVTGSGTTGVTDSGHSGHGIGSYATTGAGGASSTYNVVQSAGVTSGGDGTWSTWDNIDMRDFVAAAGSFVTVSIQRSSASSAEYASFRLDQTFSSNYFPDSNGIKVPLSDSAGNQKSFATCTIYTPEPVDITSPIYNVQVKLDGLSASESGWTAYTTAYNIGTHTHPTSGTSGSATAVISDPGHTNALSKAAVESDDGVARNIAVYVDGSLVTTISSVSLNATNSVDLTSVLTTTGFHTVELRPAAGQVGLDGTVTITGFKP